MPASVGRANWYDVAWRVPYLFLTAFASRWRAEEEVQAKEEDAPEKVSIFSRLLPACVPLLVLLMSRRITHEQITLAWAVITASFVVSTVRLILTNEKQLRAADELRKTESALQQSSEMFTTAFRSSLDAVSISLLPEGAAYLKISVKTAETHRANIMLKLSFHSVTELVRYAVKNKIIQA